MALVTPHIITRRRIPNLRKRIVHATKALLGGKDPVPAEDVGEDVGQGEGVGQNLEEDEQ